MGDWPEELERGWTVTALEGEPCSGDAAVFAPTAEGGLACAIDGLGHGPEAAEAAEICGDVVRAHAGDSPQELLDACHEALRGSRGVVMTVAWFNLERGELSWTGVGNIDARLVRSGPRQREEVALVFGGVVGHQMPRIRLATMTIARGDLLVMISDGVEGAISPALAGGGSAQALADRIVQLHGKGSDDALAIVVRYR